jgi:hypothetical protein
MRYLNANAHSTQKIFKKYKKANSHNKRSEKITLLLLVVANVATTIRFNRIFQKGGRGCVSQVLNVPIFYHRFRKWN